MGMGFGHGGECGFKGKAKAGSRVGWMGWMYERRPKRDEDDYGDQHVSATFLIVKVQLPSKRNEKKVENQVVPRKAKFKQKMSNATVKLSPGHELQSHNESKVSNR